MINYFKKYLPELPIIQLFCLQNSKNPLQHKYIKNIKFFKYIVAISKVNVEIYLDWLDQNNFAIPEMVIEYLTMWLIGVISVSIMRFAKTPDYLPRLRCNGLLSNYRTSHLLSYSLKHLRKKSPKFF